MIELNIKDLKSEKGRGLAKLLEEPSKNSKGIQEKTINYLLSEGFEEYYLDEMGNERIYALEDSRGPTHLGSSYGFLITPNTKNYKLIRSSEKGDGCVYGVLLCRKSHKECSNSWKYSGLDAPRAAIKILEIKKAIAKAKAEGLFETSEHISLSNG